VKNRPGRMQVEEQVKEEHLNSPSAPDDTQQGRPVSLENTGPKHCSECGRDGHLPRTCRKKWKRIKRQKQNKRKQEVENWKKEGKQFIQEMTQAITSQIDLFKVILQKILGKLEDQQQEKKQEISEVSSVSRKEEKSFEQMIEEKEREVYQQVNSIILLPSTNTPTRNFFSCEVCDQVTKIPERIVCEEHGICEDCTKKSQQQNKVSCPICFAFKEELNQNFPTPSHPTPSKPQSSSSNSKISRESKLQWKEKPKQQNRSLENPSPSPPSRNWVNIKKERGDNQLGWRISGILMGGKRVELRPMPSSSSSSTFPPSSTSLILSSSQASPELDSHCCMETISPAENFKIDWKQQERLKQEIDDVPTHVSFDVHPVNVSENQNQNQDQHQVPHDCDVLSQTIVPTDAVDQSKNKKKKNRNRKRNKNKQKQQEQQEKLFLSNSPCARNLSEFVTESKSGLFHEKLQPKTRTASNVFF